MADSGPVAEGVKSRASSSATPSTLAIPSTTGSDESILPPLRASISSPRTHRLSAPDPPTTFTRKLAEDGLSYHFVDMKHQFPILDEQVKSGLYVMKRAAALLRKVTTFHEEFSRNLQRVTEHEKDEKRDELEKDNMVQHRTVVVNLASVLATYAEKHRVLAARVNSDIIPKFTEFMLYAEAKRHRIVEKEAKISEIGRAVQQECRDRSRMPSSA
eukprot:TRINITY_DN17315_c0_g1_i7.p1 TRINITY_DN17315_c0_g1~~TRINITY_DN17315_c0_g1_i7.p1  ORF type:complete len:215 (-),score=26.76 TRINITY_DN17315_c0_g1_i7:11-655(-)